MPHKTPRKLRAGLPAALSLLALSALACNLLGAPTATPAPPTLTPSPLAPGATDTAAPAPTDPPTQAPTDAPTQPPTVAPPSETPAAEPSPTAEATTPASPTAPAGHPGPAPHEAILILEPGLISRVTSPVRVAGFALPTFEQNLVIQVTDADGNIIATQPTTIQAELGTAGPYSQDVAFAVTAEQPGRISVFTTSARDGGLEHLSSVEVTLLPGGAPTIEPVAPYTEVHSIALPAPLAEISGGMLHIEGFSEYTFEANLVLVLCGEGGSGAPDLVCGTADNVLAMAPTTIHSPDVGQPGPYSADLSYTVTSRVAARLAVYSASARDGGITHLSSVPIYLNP
jgi:hypothetical protein